MNEAFIVRNRIALSCKGGHVVVHAAEKKAAALGVPECIAVVDGGGQLPAFSRMDCARPAARRRRATAEEGGGDELAAPRIGQASQLDVTAVGGGLPIVYEGRVLGRVGVSSGTPDEDVVVAEAGIAALLAQ